MLEVEGLGVAYGDAPALWDVSLGVAEGELVCVVGPNGSGKTTLINAIAGLLRARAGSVRFRGEELTRVAPHEVCRRGIAIVPEGRRLFTGMTVEENLDMGAYLRTKSSEIAADRDRIYSEIPRLAERRKQAAGTLSGGEQQMLAIGRALMSRPRLIMFDEPSLGLAPNIVERTFAIIRGIRDAGTTVLLVEQNAFAALEMCDHAYLLEGGRIVLSGRGAEMIENEHVRKAYLGG
jgi:branched-chain amino acid transport system ATP-binding protein